MTVGERIRYARERAGLSVDDIANKLNKNRSTVYRYESDEIEDLPFTIMYALAEILNVNPAYLMGWVDNPKPTDRTAKSIQIPVLGCVKAGYPMEAIENVIDYEEIPSEMAKKGDYFGLKIKGDSMEPKFSDGDVIIVRKQPIVDNGEIAVVLVNGDEATVKKFYKLDSGVQLISTNPIYEPFFYTADEVNNLPVVVIGKVVELRAKF